MIKTLGSSRNLLEKYNKIIYEEINKNDPNNESSILNKKLHNSCVYILIIIIFYRYRLLKSKSLEIEDDSTSSDSYSEKVPSTIIMEKFTKIVEIIKDLNEQCNIKYILISLFFYFNI